MLKEVAVNESLTLEDYAAVPHLSAAVQAARDDAASLLPRLKGRRAVMINSAATGGGVAEMLPRLVSVLDELGLPTRWLVMSPDEPDFFTLTKRLHNLIHGHGDPELTSEDRQLYESVSAAGARVLRGKLSSGDLLVIHDPQPMGMGALVRKETGHKAIWRCHIGLDGVNRQTRSAWDFLRPYAEKYDHSIFSTPEYVPDFLADRSGIIYPAIDPLSHKNRDLSPHKLVGILCNARLAVEHHPVLTPPFAESTRRLRPDGSFSPSDEIGLLYRPIVTQISRWDRLKGFGPLIQAFVHLKDRLRDSSDLSRRHRRRLRILRLVLAGPDPASLQDDPEGREVLEELCSAYRTLDPCYQDDIALLILPMSSRKHNALIVNALQRCSTVVVQNSIQEGFGLTITEAMWKGRSVVGTHACGPRTQIRDTIDGRLVRRPEDPEEIAAVLHEVLSSPAEQSRYAASAQRRVHDEFLVFSQARRWIRCLAAEAGS